jgi:Na+/H+ antiporter NhaB
MLITSILGIFLNIVIAWILAEGGLAMFKDIIIGIIITPKDDEKSTGKSFNSRTRKK